MTEFRYADRDQAGGELARELGDLSGPIVVLGVPRGGVIVAHPIAERFRAPLAVALARKLTLPVAPELAVGAVDEEGHVLVDYEILHQLGGSSRDLTEARGRAMAEIERQRALYHAPVVEDLLPLRTAVVVDDGLATGLTLRASLAHLRRHGAQRVVVAVPCASTRAAASVAREADRLVCPIVDAEFVAVGAYYEQFGPVSDELVVATLERARGFLTAG